MCERTILSLLSENYKILSVDIKDNENVFKVVVKVKKKVFQDELRMYLDIRNIAETTLLENSSEGSYGL